MTGRGWFRPWGWTYRPASWPGFVVMGMGMGMALGIGLAAVRGPSTVVDALTGAIPMVVSGFLLIDWIASRTADEPRRRRPPERWRSDRDRILH